MLKFVKDGKLAMIEKDNKELVILDEELKQSFNKQPISNTEGKNKNEQ